MESTGKSFSEALIFASTNPQYDDRLFIEFPEKYMFTNIVLNVKTKQRQQFVYTTCSADILSLEFSWTIYNLSSHFGLVDAKIRASEKDLPVHTSHCLDLDLMAFWPGVTSDAF